MLYRTSALAVLISLELCCSCLAEETSVDFSREILPLLSDKCFVCHGPDAKDPDLVRLDSFDGATADLG